MVRRLLTLSGKGGTNMILRDTVTREGRSEQFALYPAGSIDPSHDVHVRIEPSEPFVAWLGLYNRRHQVWHGMSHAEHGRIAAEVWKRYGKRVPGEVLA